MRQTLHGVNIGHIYDYVSEEEIKRLQAGKWENEDVVLVNKYLTNDDSVLELGACTGILSCVINSIIGGSHLVVEPNPELIKCIEETRRRNSCDFEIKNTIVSDNEYEEFEAWDFVLGSGCPSVNADRDWETQYIL